MAPRAPVPSLRLLTLTGPGGTGKTRLGLQAAAEAAERYRDGAFWVPLAALRDSELVLVTAGQALFGLGDSNHPLKATEKVASLADHRSSR